MSLLTASEPRTAPGLDLDSQTAIRLEKISVRYRVSEEQIGTFKEYMIRRIQGRVNHRQFLALNGVDLEVERGEIFGVIGRNGAGKSTLLKVISRVIRASDGRVVVRGRVAPLLELGAGFHPELTGRENVFLNGTLLGHSRREVQQKFDAILEFADLGGFIEAPLRTYSTGMVGRLGFAVATAWMPDILLLDEILTVGDEAFQAKCLERIRAFRNSQATVVMVSHSAATIRSMCRRAVWLDHGEVRLLGEATPVTEAYQSFLDQTRQGGGELPRERGPDPRARRLPP
ncbi:MAG: ABC transporter ATP-binding protein [Anaerolineales bacterium]|jgi:ABC-type polysaccharide/polyol phosphate transport system ATPase subunit